MGNGLSAGFQIEREIRGGGNTSQNEDGTVLRQRHNLVYLSGGFGTVTLGHQNNPYLNARNWDQTFFYGGNWSESYRHEGINYSMSSGPFSLNVMALANNANIDADLAIDEDEDNVADALACTDFGFAACGNAMITPQGEVSGDDGIDGWIIHAGYDFGPVALNVAHHANNQDFDINTTVNNGGLLDANLTAFNTAVTTVNNAAADANATRDRTAIGVNGVAGPVDWYLAYQTTELNASGNYDANDVSSIGGFLGFNMSEKDTLYAYYVTHSADRSTLGADGDTTMIVETLGEDYTETIFGYARTIGPGVRFIAEYAAQDLDLEDDDDAGNNPNNLALVIRMDF